MVGLWIGLDLGVLDVIGLGLSSSGLSEDSEDPVEEIDNVSIAPTEATEVDDEEKVEEDELKPGDVRTMIEMTKMANSISKIIQWTSDCPGGNEDGKMPILDLKVWLSEEEGEQKIQFEFCAVGTGDQFSLN